jgi:hypothetical protein
LKRQPYREPGRRTRLEYLLTQKGRDLLPVVLGLFEWGAKYVSPGGRSPVRLTHTECGAPMHVEIRCGNDHQVPLRELAVGPTARRT